MFGKKLTKCTKWAGQYVLLGIVKYIPHAEQSKGANHSSVGQQYWKSVLVISGFKPAPPPTSTLFTTPSTQSSIRKLDIFVHLEIVDSLFNLHSAELTDKDTKSLQYDDSNDKGSPQSKPVSWPSELLSLFLVTVKKKIKN